MNCNNCSSLFQHLATCKTATSPQVTENATLNNFNLQSPELFYDENNSASVKPFQCGRGSEMMELSVRYQNYSLLSDGNILAWFPAGAGNTTHSIQIHDYCIEQVNLDNLSSLICTVSTHSIQITQDFTKILYCDNECDGEVLAGIIYPTGLCVSCVFFLLTLSSYLIQQEHQTLIDKITIGYLINNLFAYVCLITRFMQTHKK